MADYHDYLPHHRNRRVRQADKHDRVMITLLLVMLLVAMGLAGREDMLDRDRKVAEWRPVVTYDKPAAYRLQSPTTEQMDHVEHMMAVQQVVK